MMVFFHLLFFCPAKNVFENQRPGSLENLPEDRFELTLIQPDAAAVPTNP
jgi:hypothetical protein